MTDGRDWPELSEVRSGRVSPSPRGRMGLAVWKGIRAVVAVSILYVSPPVVVAAPDAPDRDRDGIADREDKCERDPEDRDGFDDRDGCPDPDNDQDGVLDALDRCPNEAEDLDGFADQDGCDEADNDHDGIADIVDLCQLEPETINGHDDDDGCPDNGVPMVMVLPDRLETVNGIHFVRERLKKDRYNVLAQVAATMRARKDLLRVQVVSHVNPGRNAQRDVERTAKRAAAVRLALVHWGVEPDRLESVGAGGAQPLVPAKAKRAKELNDRVELMVLERAPK